MIFPCKQCGEPMKRDRAHPSTLPHTRCDECRGMHQRKRKADARGQIKQAKHEAA